MLYNIATRAGLELTRYCAGLKCLGNAINVHVHRKDTRMFIEREPAPISHEENVNTHVHFTPSVVIRGTLPYTLEGSKRF